MTNTNILAAKHYAKRDPEAQGAHYINHVSAMTSEGLHSKSAIAAELAHRDMEIDRLRAALAAPAQPVCKPPKLWNKRGQDAYRRGWEAREAALAAAAPAQPVPAPGGPSEAPTQAQVDERSDTVWLFIRLGQRNIRRAITLLEIDSTRAPELAFGPLLLKAIAELRKT